MFKGIIPPVITPLQSQNKVDTEGLIRLLEHILSGGVNGLFILGTSGEGPSLSYDLRYEVIKRVCSHVDGRVPVLAGITDTSFTESLELAKYAAVCGSDAVVAAPPYYFTVNQQELIRYYLALADQSPLPLFLYNMPPHTKINITPETVELLSDHPNIIGFKDSSGDVIYFQKVLSLLKNRQNFPVFVGPEEILMQTMMSGGDGGVNGGANLFPKLYVAMYDAVIDNDFNRMHKLQEKILEVSSKLYTIGNSPMKYLQGVKCALSLMGICSDVMAFPYQSLSSEEKKQVQKALQELNMDEVLV